MRDKNYIRYLDEKVQSVQDILDNLNEEGCENIKCIVVNFISKDGNIYSMWGGKFNSYAEQIGMAEIIKQSMEKEANG